MLPPNNGITRRPERLPKMKCSVSAVRCMPLLGAAPGEIPKLIGINRRGDYGVNEIIKPPMRNLQNVLRRTACTNRHEPRLIVWHKLNVNRDAAFMHKFIPEPFIKDVLDRMSCATKLYADSDGVSAR